MREVVRQFPDDLDAATLFAEAGMNLHPWGCGMRMERPKLELRRSWQRWSRSSPRSESSGRDSLLHPRRGGLAQPGTRPGRSQQLASLAPAAGHIVHMPAHIYIRTGDYAAAVKTNEEAAAVDRAYMRATGVQGIYPMMYYSHNLHFIAMCSAMDGNYLEAKKNADMLAAHVGPHVKEMPPLEGFMTIPLAVDIRFHRWADILAAAA